MVDRQEQNLLCRPTAYLYVTQKKSDSTQNASAEVTAVMSAIWTDLTGLMPDPGRPLFALVYLRHVE
jgi:hypothetical protein